MIRIFRLSPEHVADAALLDAFVDRVNDHEQECQTANILPKVDINVAPDGSLIASVQYFTVDHLNKGNLRGLLRDEVQRKFADAKRSAITGS